MKWLLWLPAMLLLSCGMHEKTDILLECASPSGEKLATIFRISSGKRPGDQVIKLNIRPAGNSFHASMHSFAFRHGYDAIIHWESEQRIRLEYPQYSSITEQEQVIFGSSQTFNAQDPITMIYKERPSTHGYFMVEKRCFN